MIRVREPGLLSTIQDQGRYGCAHMGISPAGAADPVSFRIANLLVGNDPGAPALEMTLLGPILEFEQRTTVALAGASCECRLGSGPAPFAEAFEVLSGEVLACGSMLSGARSYLAVQGGFDVPLILGSASTYLPGCFGGLEGRKLKAGDLLQIRSGLATAVRKLRPGALPDLAPERIRVTRGAQQGWFDPEQFLALYSAGYTVSESSNRSGLRLIGPALRPRTDAQLLTDGIPLGAIQVPADGQPIVLFVDQQTTGGYPKIANVIAADRRGIGQLRPRDQVWFSEVSIADAVEALREQEAWLRDIFMP